MRSIISRKSVCATGIALAMFSGGAGASIQWDFSNTGTVFDPSNPATEDTISASVEPSGSPTVNVSGWTEYPDNDPSNIVLGDTDTPTMISETVYGYSGGLGVNEGQSSPQHALDNNGANEMILFEFSDDVEITEVGIGWSIHGDSYTDPYGNHLTGDTDLTLLAYTGSGAPDLASYKYAASSNNTYDPNDTPAGSTTGLTQDGWVLVGNYWNIGTGNVAVNDGSNTGGTAVSSSYWLVAALEPTVNGVSNTETYYNDFMKIDMLAGNVAPPHIPPVDMPVPATLWLFLLGLPATFYLRRRA